MDDMNVPRPAQDAGSKEHYYCGKIYLESGELDKAINEFRKAHDADPGDPNIMIGLGRSYLAGGNTNEAVGILETALKKAPDYADIHYYLGLAFTRAGDREKATNEFKEALNINPKYNAAKQQLDGLLKSGERRHRRKQKKLKQKEVEEQRKSKQANVHFHMGNALYEKGMLKEAMAEYKEALSLRPNYPDIHNRLGEVYMARGAHQKAEEEFLASLKINPKYLAALLNLAETRRIFAEELLDKAEKDFENVLELDPANKQAARGLEKVREFKSIDYI